MAYNNNGFLLKSFTMTNKKQNIIIELDLGKMDKKNSNSYNTVFIGKNSAGKSFVLKHIVAFFNAVESSLKYNTERGSVHPKNLKEIDKNSRFNVAYNIGGNEVVIQIAEDTIYFKVNGQKLEPSPVLIDYIPKVLACSFIAHDRFPYYETASSKESVYQKYRYLGIRQARKSSNRTYTSSINSFISESILGYKSEEDVAALYDVLAAIGYDRDITINWDAKPNQIYVLRKMEKDPLNKDKKFLNDKGTIYGPVEKIFIDHGDYKSKYQEISSEMKNFSSLQGNINFFPELFFSKQNEKYDLDKISSGEKQILFTLTQLIAYKDEFNLILIDEPESSLHPDLQICYFSILNKVFANVSSHFICATHSHFLVSDLEPDKSSIIMFEEQGGERVNHLIEKNTYGWSAENILYEVFRLRSSRNYYFQKDLESFVMALANDDFLEAAELKRKLAPYVLNDNDPLKSILEAIRDEVINKKD